MPNLTLVPQSQLQKDLIKMLEDSIEKEKLRRVEEIINHGATDPAEFWSKLKPQNED